EVRMGEACVRIGESDDPCQDAAARVRGERYHELAQQVLGRLRLIEPAEAVEPLQEVIDEPCHADQVLAARPRDHDVLRPQLDGLVLPLEGTAAAVPHVSAASGGLRGTST